MAMNLRPNHPVGQALGRLAEQVRAVPASGATVPNVDSHRGDPAGPERAARRFVRRTAGGVVAWRALRRRCDNTGRRRGAHRRGRCRRDGARRRGGECGHSRRGHSCLDSSRPPFGVGRVGGHRLRASVGSAACRRRHRNVGQDHYDISGGGRPAIGGAGGRTDRHCRRPYRRTRSAQRADHTRGARSAGAAGADGRTGRRHGGDGGVQSRADIGPRRRRALRGRRFHQSVARPPRLPPDDAGLFRRQGAAVRSRLAGARKHFSDLHRRRRGTCHGPRRRTILCP